MLLTTVVYEGYVDNMHVNINQKHNRMLKYSTCIL
jgi:hypothetical protein